MERHLQGRVSAIPLADRELAALSRAAEGNVHWLLEFLLLAVAIATLIRFAIPNYNALMAERYDSKALSVFGEISAHLTETKEPLVIWINGASNKGKPSLLSETNIPIGLSVDYAIKAEFPGFFSVKLLSVTHGKGAKRFRMVEVDERRIQQVIAK